MNYFCVTCLIGSLALWALYPRELWNVLRAKDIATGKVFIVLIYLYEACALYGAVVTASILLP